MRSHAAAAPSHAAAIAISACTCTNGTELSLDFERGLHRVDDAPHDALATTIGVAQASLVTVELPKKVEDDLRVLARRQGRSIDVLLEEAVEQYLEAAAITDTTPDEIAATQEALLGELPAMEAWETEGT